MNAGKFTDKESELFNALEAKKSPIQSEIDGLMGEIQEASKAVEAIREKVKVLRPQLVPFAEMQAALASPLSRDKYFPDFSKNQFTAHVESQL